MMSSGLQTFANLGNRVAATFALAPIDWGLHAAGPFGAMAR